MIWTENGIYVINNNKLHVSRDNGVTFTQIFDGASFDVAYSTTTGNLYVGTFTGVQYSTNQGQSFAPLPTTTLPAGSVQGLLAQGGKLYVSLTNATTGFAFASEQNFNFTARGTANGMGSNFCRRAFVSGNNVYVPTSGGLSISTDNGQTFTNRTQGLPSTNTYSAAVASSGRIFVGTQAGLAVSDDGGATFQQRLDTKAFYDVRIDSNRRVFVASEEGYGMSRDNGDNFQFYKSTRVLKKPFVNKVVIVPSGEIFPLIYVHTSAGIEISIDGGVTFRHLTVGNGIVDSQIFTIGATATALYVSTSTTFLISRDRGETFTARTGASYGLASSAFRSIAAVGETVYVGMASAVAVSRDGGQSFVASPLSSSSSISGIAADEAGHVFVVAGSNYYVSTNSGGTFARLTNNGLPASGMYSVFQSGANVFVGTGSGLYISNDWGVSFSARTTANGLSSNSVNGIVVAGSTIYVGTSEFISTSTDGGNTFRAVRRGIADPGVGSLAADDKGNVFVGTYDSGLSALMTSPYVTAD
jgi:ligand-binding sensor domain-containing protein